MLSFFFLLLCKREGGKWRKETRKGERRGFIQGVFDIDIKNKSVWEKKEKKNICVCVFI